MPCCKGCRSVHVVPVPKTASESTKVFFGYQPCALHPGTHKHNLRLPALRGDWRNASEVRVATLREPRERFRSTLEAIQEYMRSRRLNRADEPYRALIGANTTAAQLLRNASAMRRLAGGLGSGHFLPASAFLLRDGCWNVHVVLDFDWLAVALPAVYEAVLGAAAPRVPRVNDPVAGPHRNRTNYAGSELVARWYPHDTYLYHYMRSVTLPGCQWLARGAWECWPVCD